MAFDLDVRLQERAAQALIRKRRQLQGPQVPQTLVDGREMLCFCSNDYLGLAAHPEVIRALRDGAQRWGAGGGASHLVCGHMTPHHALEEALAAFTGRPRALLFSTGYMANLAVVTALAGRGDTVLQDRLNHASLLDGGLLSGADYRRYRHNDCESLALQLDRSHGDVLAITDGVFSMDGDMADLPGMCGVLQKRDNAWLMVDDAHGFGVLGAQGGGVAEHFGLTFDQLPVLVGTLGKAFGTAGAFVAGSEVLIETLVQFARPYIYTTSQPPAISCATLRSLQLAREEGWRREHLQDLIGLFRHEAALMGLPLLESVTPIQPIVVGDSAEALRLSAALEAQGILVTAIRPPTVPAGTARLRVTLSAAHTREQVEHLLLALQQCWKAG